MSGGAPLRDETAALLRRLGVADSIFQGGDRAVLQVIKPAVHKREIGSELPHRRREIDVDVEPWFHRVLVGGNHVH